MITAEDIMAFLLSVAESLVVLESEGDGGTLEMTLFDTNLMIFRRDDQTVSPLTMNPSAASIASSSLHLNIYGEFGLLDRNWRSLNLEECAGFATSRRIFIDCDIRRDQLEYRGNDNALLIVEISIKSNKMHIEGKTVGIFMIIISSEMFGIYL